MHTLKTAVRENFRISDTSCPKIDDEASVQAGRRHLPLATRKLQPHDALDGQAGEQPAGNICQAEHAAHSAAMSSHRNPAAPSILH